MLQPYRFWNFCYIWVTCLCKVCVLLWLLCAAVCGLSVPLLSTKPVDAEKHRRTVFTLTVLIHHRHHGVHTGAYMMYAMFDLFYCDV